MNASVNFNEETGAINRNLHGSNSAPPLYPRAIYDFVEPYKAMRFTGARTHDWALWNKGQRIIDTHFVFPLMKLDPADPSNYYFAATDAAIKICQDTGTRVFYRLGTSIEHTGDLHFNTVPPTDFEKYAEVLAGIVRHYTRGWADGFHYDIEYWEIWNEPELVTKMWAGPFDDFVRFFAVVLKRLKNEFPELKFGGPAHCSLNEPLFRKLLAACREAGVAPDFISWHCYTADARNLIAQPARGRGFLDSLGFTETELCINEWHYLMSWDGLHVNSQLFRRAYEGPSGFDHIDSAAFNLAVLSGWQETPLDSAFYYGAGVEGNWGFRDIFKELNKNYYSMVLYGDFIHRYPVKTASAAKSSSVYTLAARTADGKRGALLLTDYRGETPTLEVALDGVPENSHIRAKILDDTRDLIPVPVLRDGDALTLVKANSGSAAWLIEFTR